MSVDNCNPDEKFSEYMNNPQGYSLKLIEEAIKKGRSVSSNGASSPYLNSMGENLAGVCHMGETPNPSDVTNPFAPPPAFMNNQPRSGAIIR